MAFTAKRIKNRITVDYEELTSENSPDEGASKDGPRATRMLKCTWANRWQLTRELVGTWEYQARSDTLIIREPHPYPANAEAKCVDVSIKGFGKPVDTGVKGVAAYQHAILICEYEIPEEEDYASESLEPAAEFLTLPNRELFWDNAQAEPLSEDESPGVLYCTLNWVYVRHKMPYVPMAVLNLIGFTNNAAITSPTLRLTFAQDTLLFEPPSLSREISTVQGQYQMTKAWRMEMRFAYRPTGWNRFPKRGEGLTFQPLFDSSGSPKLVYPQGDFSDLFWSF